MVLRWLGFGLQRAATRQDIIKSPSLSLSLPSYLEYFQLLVIPTLYTQSASLTGVLIRAFVLLTPPACYPACSLCCYLFSCSPCVAFSVLLVSSPRRPTFCSALVRVLSFVPPSFHLQRFKPATCCVLRSRNSVPPVTDQISPPS